MLVNKDSDSRRILAAELAKGAVAVVPCDTIYGLVGLAPETEQRIRDIKGRQDKPFIHLIGEESWLSRLTGQSLPLALASYWPGPLTLVFSSLESTDRKTVAVRMPRDAFLRDVLSEINHPLFSTSVNRAGQPALWRIRDIVDQFSHAVDLIIDDGDLPGNSASTILDIHQRPYHLLRQGEMKIPSTLLE